MTNPADIRTIFGSNLKKLSVGYSSITYLAQELGINRTQFNRYLSGESFPRPDILDRMCKFFDVDARVLLEPLEEIKKIEPTPPDFMGDFIVSGALDLPEATFPSGFYRFSRRSFLYPEKFALGLVMVFRSGRHTYLRGYEAPHAMRIQSLPTHSELREYRGVVLQQEEGIAIIASRRGAMTSSFNYLGRIASFNNNFWVGYITRTVPENSIGLRATRLVYEYLPQTPSAVLQAARLKGLCEASDLEPFHRHLLRTEFAFE